MDGSFEGEGRRYVLYGFVLLFVVGFGLMAWASVQRVRSAGEVVTPVPWVAASPEASEVAEVPAVPTPTASPSSSPSVVASVTPSPSPSVSVGEGTVLFGGGSARGPWQQLGTVAEITHPGAPLSARYSWVNFWSDPEEENQPDALWDRLVVEVTEQLVELGEPVDRPVFGGAEGSEPFNSFGGVQDVYPDGTFTASWEAYFEDADGVGEVYFAFLISESGEIRDSREPLVIRESEVERGDEADQRAYAQIRQWAAERGFTDCARC